MGISRIAAASAALALLVAATAPATLAKTRRFGPLQLVPTDSSLNVSRSPVAVAGLAGTATFVAPLRLPAGTTITGLRVAGNGNAGGEGAQIRRHQVGGPPGIIAQAIVPAAVPDLFTPAWVDGTLTPSLPDRVISPAYLYFVVVGCPANTAVWAVDVEYAP